MGEWRKTVLRDVTLQSHSSARFLLYCGMLRSIYVSYPLTRRPGVVTLKIGTPGNKNGGRRQHSLKLLKEAEKQPVQTENNIITKHQFIIP